MFGGCPLPETTPLVLSPTDSESDYVADLFDNGNCDSLAAQYQAKPSRLDTFNQIASSLHLPVSTNYSRSSCPNLTGITAGPVLSCTLLNTSENDNEDLLNTPHGTLTVAKEGNPRGPAIITLHDIGLNHSSNFQSFFNCSAMRSILTKFCIYHITAPGQHVGAPDIAAHSHYPSMEQLAEMVESVCHHYSVSHCVGLGVGMGANVLVRLASRKPKLIDGLIVINCNSQTSGWMEWAYHKVNMKALKKAKKLPDTVVDYLLWHHLGSIVKEKGRGHICPAAMFRQYFQAEVNPCNLAPILQSYVNRSDLKINREKTPGGKTKPGAPTTLEMSVLNIVGDRSPHVEATVTLNSRLNPAKCTWMKIQNAGMVLEEQQEKVAEAVGLFLQGLGHTLRMGRSRSAVETRNRLSLQLKGYETPLVKMKVQHTGNDLKV